ncbi:hypothetical protein Tco_1207902 [Tanacetum coccineum]
MNGPYVRRMIPKPGDPDRKVSVNETFHEQTDEELTEKELKQVEANDQAIRTILLGSDIGIQEKKSKLFNEWERFTSTDEESIESYYHRFSKLINDFKRNKHFPEKIASNLKFLNNLQPEFSRHVTIVHQTKDLHKAYYTQLYDFLKYNQKEVNELRAERLARAHDPLALMANSNNPYNYRVFHQDQPSQISYMQQSPPNNNYNPQPSFNQNYMQQPMPNLEDITDPITAMNMALVLMAKTFKLNYSTPTNNNHIISSNPRNRQIAQPGMNLGQDKQMQMVGGNDGNPFRQYDRQNVGNRNGYNASGLIAVLGIANPNANQNRNGNVVAARAEVGPMRKDVAYLQTLLLIAKKKETGIQLQDEEFDLMADVEDIDEIEKVNANCILIANLQQASTSEQYTELLEPITDPHPVQQNNSNVISVESSVAHNGGTVEQHPATVKETHAYFESLYNNLAIEVEKVNTVNHKIKETNADLTTELDIREMKNVLNSIKQKLRNLKMVIES